MTIHRGLLQDVRPNMGVVSPQGIVGTVVNVSDNYASVMTLLHRQYKVVVKLKNGGERGTVEWDGVSPMFVTLKDIPKSAKVKSGRFGGDQSHFFFVSGKSDGWNDC